MNLKQFWYPIFISNELKKNKLVPIELFGESFVLFRDENNNPVFLEDRCPHRGTVLSAGKVCNGVIQCRFHGWQFGTEGKCKKIPTLHDDKKIPKNAHAKSRVCIEKYGAVWVWPDSEKSAETNRFPDELFNAGALFNTNNQRILRSWDVNYSHELAIQDILDPAHLPFVHYNSKHAAKPFTFVLDTEDPADICGYAEFQRESYIKEQYRFYAPCMVQYDQFNEKTKKNQRIQFYCVPLNKKKTRMFSYNYMVNNFIFNLLNNNIFLTTLGRFVSNLITSQDHKVLHGQYENREKGANLLNQPIASDLLVVKFKKWAEENNIDGYWFEKYTN